MEFSKHHAGFSTLWWRNCFANGRPVYQIGKSVYDSDYGAVAHYFDEASRGMKPNTDRRPRLSTPDVAELFGVTRATLYRWIAEGKIPEPARDPGNGWPIWQQPELDAIARVMKSRRNKV
jgi:excisionase family DNA binding protein